MKNSKTAKNLRALCEAAIMVALAVVLTLLRFPPFNIDLWGNGGSIDFVMVPLVVLAWRRGVTWAVPAGLAFGFLKCLISGGIGWGILSVLLDYVLAYGMVGIAGIFKDKKNGLVLGAVVGSVARFIVHFISGVTIWKIAVGDEVALFGMNFDSSMSFIYSLLYNGGYMLGNMIFCVVAVILLAKPLSKLPK
ncbi:MAG: energy-coupled thiamine transporter ThiT [Clostridia bacterium]|nr:energy-coupled thiamine transporter ThiT [Clostridia bacterium]